MCFRKLEELATLQLKKKVVDGLANHSTRFVTASTSLQIDSSWPEKIHRRTSHAKYNDDNNTSILTRKLCSVEMFNVKSQVKCSNSTEMCVVAVDRDYNGDTLQRCPSFHPWSPLHEVPTRCAEHTKAALLLQDSICKLAVCPDDELRSSSLSTDNNGALRKASTVWSTLQSTPATKF